MLPPLLTHDITQGLRHFLTAAYEPSNPFFQGLMQRFVASENQWLKGPFIQLGLPFRSGTSGRDFFPQFTLEHAGYHHQEAAWQRLSSAHLGQSTLVATGTGSGKTECFLYPLLTHASAQLALGGSAAKGIKALVIYPMNALATDQARRFAEEIAKHPAFAKLRVGLFVGGGKTSHGGNPTMTASEVITDREVMRKNPPDILLTNYKMLDYLLIRPKDRQLWAHNTPTTLRYVVIDELHSFDGAQGTDLALLLRRLRARLDVPNEHLIFAGTSATLGDANDTSGLRDYARQITGASFPPESVITENRKSVAEFLGDATIEHVFQAHVELTEILNPSGYNSQEDAVKAWHDLFFPNLPAATEVTSTAFRAQLGQSLKTHLLTHNLLKLSKGATIALKDVVEGIQGPLPLSVRPQAADILNALLSLLAWARDAASPSQPLLTLREQIWIRELRRMVTRVHPDPSEINLLPSADLPARPNGVHLPLIQCADCRTTGWLSVQQTVSGKVSLDLDEIYNNWFAAKPEVARLYPVSDALKRPSINGVIRQLCGECGNLQAHGSTCQACGFDAMVAVFQPTEIIQSTYHEAVYTRHDDTCPACASTRRQLLIGARNTTLGSQVIERSWASNFNDDKKLIAFSDSVQDAAHRAGFFAARTYRNIIRYALSQYLDKQPATISLASLLNDLPVYWQQKLGAGAFATTFIGPNMMWLRDWEKLQKEDLPLSDKSKLPERVSQRLSWEIFAELSYHSRRGRTLDALGLATCGPALSAIKTLLPALQEKLENEFGLRGVSQRRLLQWVWGFCHRLKYRGGIMAFDFLADFGETTSLYRLLKIGGRNEWMPAIGQHQISWLSLDRHRHFDKVTSGDSNWFHKWLLVTIGENSLLPSGITGPCYDLLCKLLMAQGLLIKCESDQFGASFALAGETMLVSTDVCRLATSAGVHNVSIAREWQSVLQGMPCPEAMTESLSEIAPTNHTDAQFVQRAQVRRVISAEHTGLLQRPEREAIEQRFKAKPAESQPWYENLLSATPTLEMGVDIGSLSSVMLCSVPPNQASFLQRIGRAGRRDGNSIATTLADGSSPHDLYFFAETEEMLSGEVTAPGIFLKAAEVLRRQLFAFCLDAWVGSGIAEKALPEKSKDALDAVHSVDDKAFPYTLLNYMQVNEETLLARFVALLGDDADDRVKKRLSEFMTGSEAQQTLRWQLLNVFEGLLKERSVHKQRADKYKSDLTKENAKPRDEARDETIAQLTIQRDMSIAQAREINERDLLNTLTDAGLIPNYAFPEVGVQLKSLLWRKKASDEDAQGNYVTLPAMNFERPASSALSEFAPENKFYANQRRVEINQIDMKLATMEDWRLCPSCHHMENLTEVADSHSACQRCGDVMWANVSQKQTLLRFKQAIANAEDADARIDDRQEDREPKFYQRQLLVDFTPEDVTCAWKLDSDRLPFGFEFIRKAHFRDVNFGEKGKNCQLSKVAGKETTRPGFTLCKECGTVQVPKRRALKPGETPQNHSFECSKRTIDSDEHLIDCLYLYREFSSEALRILVPFTTVGVDDKAIHSFMAAIQLGLKKRFGGKVDHLRMTTYEEPASSDSTATTFVMLYDAVPGGTGYLHQLLSEDAQTLGEIFELALQQLSTCLCQQDPDKDGCYRCVFQYRMGRSMAQTSRQTAHDLLTELLGEFAHLKPAKNLQGISTNATADSKLELLFLNALVRLGKEKDMPNVRLLTDIVRGKSGYQLQVGHELYWIEPQVLLGKDDGFPIGSKPDYVIWPRLTQSPRRPIAVFTDGWKDHKNSMPADALKRTGLVRSGKFWVWSVTWEDVKQALDGNPKTDLASPFGASVQKSNLPAAFVVQPEKDLLLLNSLGLLLSWLNTTAKSEDPFLTRLQKTALCLGLQCLGTSPDALSPIAKPWLQRLPAAARVDMAQRYADAVSKPNTEPQLIFEIAKNWTKADLAQDNSPALLLLNDNEADDKAKHLNWRKWLSWSNALQVLPGFWLLTHRLLDEHALDNWVNPSTMSGATQPVSGDDTAWQDVFNSAIKSVHAGLRQLQAAVVPGEPPFAFPRPDEIGAELADDNGYTQAEAELVWHEYKVVVLTPSQEEYADIWHSSGYRVVMAASVDWPSQVLKEFV